MCPVYISEYAETSIRGSLGTCFQLFLTIGILFVFACGALKLSWVLLSWLCIPFPVLNLIGLCFLPESPTWLLKNVSFAENQHYFYQRFEQFSSYDSYIRNVLYFPSLFSVVIQKQQQQLNGTGVVSAMRTMQFKLSKVNWKRLVDLVVLVNCSTFQLIEKASLFASC